MTGLITRKILKILWTTGISVVLLIAAALVTLQFPQVQTGIGKVVMAKLNEKIDGDIEFEKIHLKPFTTLILKNVVITDKEPFQEKADSLCQPIDTFFTAKYIIAKFTIKGLLGNDGLHFDKAVVTDAKMALVIEDMPGQEGKETMVNLVRIFNIRPNPDKKSSEKELFFIRKAEIKNMEFVMKNFSAKKPATPSGGINWNDLDVMDISISARNLRFKGGVMSGIGDKVAFREKSGYVCRKISSTGVKVGNGKTIVENLCLEDGMSSLDLPFFMMSYTCPADFSDFLTKVKLDGIIRQSVLDFNTLWYFAPQLWGNRLKISLSGGVSGYVNNFNLDKVKVSSHDGGFSGTVSGNMSGLPDISKTTLDMKIPQFHMTAKGLGRFVGRWTGNGKPDLRRYAPGTIFMLKANAKGLLNELHVRADAFSMIGGLKADATLKNAAAPEKPVSISGLFSTTDLDIGAIIGNGMIHQTTLRTGLSAQFGKDSPTVAIDSLIVDRLNLNGYDHSGIAAAGELTGESFNGKVICNNPALNFLFQGSYALSGSTGNKVYRFYANIGHADLHAMNFDKRGKSLVNLQTSADFTRTCDGKMLGKIDIGGINLENGLGIHRIGDINLISNRYGDIYRIKLNSSFADASFSGTSSIIDFIADLRNLTLGRELPALFMDGNSDVSGESYDFGLRLHNSMDLMAFAAPGFYISEGTSLDASIKSDGKVKIGLKSPRIAYKEQYLKDIDININNDDNVFSGEVLIDEVKAATLSLSDNRIVLFTDDNHIGIGYTYENRGEQVNRGEFFINGDLERNDGELELGLGILPSTLYLNSREWNITSSEIRIRGREMKVPSLTLSSGEQSIRISGRTSQAETDTLTLSLDRFDISAINPLISKDFRIRGAVSGNVRLTSPLSDKGLVGDLVWDSASVSGVELGTVYVGSLWDEPFKRFDISLKNDYDGQSNITLEGNFSPKHKLLSANVIFDRFEVGCISPFVDEIFSEIGGKISGGVSLDGPLGSLEISSDQARLYDGFLKIAYTNVKYFIDGDFHVDSEGAWFDKIAVRDRFEGVGTVGGSINWNYFRDISFDTMVSVNRMECVDIDEKNAEYFYGQVFGSGKVHIYGPMESIRLGVDATTVKSSNLHIPISSSASGTKTDLLTFRQPPQQEKIDPYEEMMRRLKQKKTSTGDFGVSLRVNATQDVEAFIEIDKASGNVLSGKGNGLINLEVGTDKFDIKGDYRLTGGKYKFSALGIVSRDFLIQDGSTINFTGDIMDSRLAIDAMYRTKASLSTLISDTTSVASRRNVECGIRISDKISSPKIDFSINIPDLDPTVKSRVESALSTDDKVQKQFISLLITNNFLPDDQSGIVNNVYGNVGDLMAGQINNIFQKLNIPLDLGLNYQTNDKGNDIFGVAISTQLFNNRVVVNGNIGNKATTSSSQNSFAGDIDIEVKLDRPGAFRLNLFSHSPDQYTNTLDDSQRSGIGLTYQTEFNTFGEFFRKMFSGKQRRQEIKMEEDRQVLEGKKKKISITEDTKKRKNVRK